MVPGTANESNEFNSKGETLVGNSVPPNLEK